MKTGLVLQLALMALGLSACTPDSNSVSGPSESTPAAAATHAAPAPDSSRASATIDSEALAKYHWRLVSATDREGKRIDVLFANANKPLQLDFDRSQVNIGNLCNHMGGQFRIHGDTLVVSQLTHTMMACADKDLMAMEGKAADVLEGDLQARLNHAESTPQLTLVAAEGATLTFNGTPSAETRYGGEGETVFLEVAAETKPCKPPGKPDAQCLEVRERHYAANGVKAGTPGAWHVLLQPIEGYRHEAGIRNVLRAKRYAIEEPPAGAASTAYVLDLIVESEVVGQ